jgi:hypothetical protein
MWCLCIWTLLLTGALAQEQVTTADNTTTTTADTTGNGGVIFTGSTFTLNNNNTTFGQYGGTIVLTGTTLNLDNQAGTGTLIVGTAVGTATTTTGTTTTTTGSYLTLTSGTTTTTGGAIILNTGIVSTTSDNTTTTTNETTTGTNDLVLSGTTTGATITINGGTNALTLSSGGTITGATLLIGNSANTLTFNGSNTYNGTTTITAGTLNVMTGGANTAANLIAALGTSLPTTGTLTIGIGGTGGVLNLANFNANGLTLVTSTTTGLPLGTTGLSITASGTTTAATVRVSALGSLPAGNAPASATFTTPAVMLLGVGDVGSQGVMERGVVYSVTSTNGAPTVGGNGVVKAVSVGLPDSSGGFALTTGGLAPNTAYSYSVYATDSSGITHVSPVATFTTPTVLQNWRQTFFGTTLGSSHAADGADPDGDGVPNLIEFATGKNPTAANNSATATPTVSSTGGLEYNYTRSLDAQNSGTIFIVEWNDGLDPTQWQSTGVTEIILSDNGILQQVKALLPATVTGKRFVRLKVLPPTGSP